MGFKLHRLRSVGIGLALSGLALLTFGGPAGGPASPRRAEAGGAVVTSLADSGPGTLRQAITDANATPGAQGIIFALGGVIELGSTLPLITDPAGLAIDATPHGVTLDGRFKYTHFAVAPGAGLAVTGLTLTHSGQVAVDNQGTFIAHDSTFVENTRGVLVNGRGASAEIRRSTLRDNPGGIGGVSGGITNSGMLLVSESTLTGNSAPAGGAIFNRWLGPVRPFAAVTNSTLSGNAAANGGAIYNDGGQLLLANSTLYQNTASVSGGGVASEQLGFADLQNSILLRNTAPTGPNCAGPVITGSLPNLTDDADGCSLLGTAPIRSSEQLGALTDNGGPTKTHALQLGSLALNAGDLAVCNAAPVSGMDQRGIARPFGNGCELGAVEATLAGGRGLSVETRYDAPLVALEWEGGNAQSGYTLLRYNVTSSAAETLPTQAATSTSYTDTSVVDGQAYCYVLLPTDNAMVLGLSDLLCVLVGTRVGTNPVVTIIGELQVRLNESNTATLEYRAPNLVGADAFKLVLVPMDGSSPQIRDFPGQPAFDSVRRTATHETGGAALCFDMLSLRGTAATNPDIICAVPGFSTVGAAAKAEAGGAPGGRAKPGVGPNQRQTIESVTKRMKEKLAPLAGRAGDVRQRAEAAVEKAMPGAGKRQ